MALNNWNMPSTFQGVPFVRQLLEECSNKDSYLYHVINNLTHKLSAEKLSDLSVSYYENMMDSLKDVYDERLKDNFKHEIKYFSEYELHFQISEATYLLDSKINELTKDLDYDTKVENLMKFNEYMEHYKKN